jgi:hypothetical protein
MNRVASQFSRGFDEKEFDTRPTFDLASELKIMDNSKGPFSSGWLV